MAKTPSGTKKTTAGRGKQTSTTSSAGADSRTDEQPIARPPESARSESGRDRDEAPTKPIAARPPEPIKQPPVGERALKTEGKARASASSDVTVTGTQRQRAPAEESGTKAPPEAKTEATGQAVELSTPTRQPEPEAPASAPMPDVPGAEQRQEDTEPKRPLSVGAGQPPPARAADKTVAGAPPAPPSSKPAAGEPPEPETSASVSAREPEARAEREEARESEQPAPRIVEPAPIEPPVQREEPESAPAEAESVHVEEPVPDLAPGPQHYEPSPNAYHGPSLYIVQVSPEMAPVAKVGGLADVVFGLSRELAIRGNHVEIILPKYANLRYDHIYNLDPIYNDLWVPWYGGAIHCTVYFGFVHDRKCFFIEPHSHDNFFNRGSIYGFADDVMRYAFFSRAAMEFMFKAGKHPDIIHCHDWQTALVPVLLYEIYQHLGMHHPRVCLTIHNFKHQGVTGMEVLKATGLHQPERLFDYNRLRDNHHANAINLLKGGVVYSNFVTTVSPRYAFETKDAGQGFGLEPTLHTHHMKYGGVVNGIDYDVWNPEIDWHIPVRYGVNSIDSKYDNKRALRHRLMLADNEKPIVAFIGRLDPQKGLELVRHAIFYSLERGAQFVLLGSSPDHGINADFWGLKRMLNDSPDCHLEIGFDEDLSHLIYAGADMMLVPSRFEPCGLTQLIALRYGTIPVVRAIGGLADTVFDKDHSNRPLHERNGYIFDHYDQPGLESALGRAIACYYNHPDHFRELIKNAMNSDYSWNIPGKDYLNIYDYIRHK